ncbi:MAG: S-layer protein [Gemmatimonadetes bacterium]|nr:S-layer protein [Gemmatimonadota bacterium]
MKAAALLMFLATSGLAQSAPVPLPAVRELLEAPTVVMIAGRQVRLDAYLWRDFMPIAASNGSPLGAVVRARTSDGTTFPAGARIEAVWIVRAPDVWTAVVTDRSDELEPATREVVASGGPKWGPGITVEVIARIRSVDGTTILVRAPSRRINRTD